MSDDATGGPLTAREALRIACQREVMAEAESVGPERVNRAAIMRKYERLGVPEVTVYRWIRQCFGSKKKQARLVDDIVRDRTTSRIAEQAEKIAERVQAEARPAAARAAAEEAVDAMPAPPSPDQVLAVGTGSTIPFMEHLRRLLLTSEEMEALARGPDGKLRNIGGMSRAAVVKLRALEVGLKAHQALAEMAEVERFHRLVIEEVAKESPEVAERIVRRLTVIAATWADG